MGKVVVCAQHNLIDNSLLFDCAGKYKVLLSDKEKFRTTNTKSIELYKDTDLVSYCRENGISKLTFDSRDPRDPSKIIYNITSTSYPDNYISFIQNNINKLDFMIIEFDPVVIQALNEIGIKPVYVYNSKEPIYTSSLSRSYRLKYEYEMNIKKLTSVHLDFVYCRTNSGKAE
jgi:hypothetical protein